MFSLESPHRGDSNEYTQYAISQYEKENHPKLPKSAAIGFFSKGPKNEFETSMVNEPLVFEPLKFYYSTMFGKEQVRSLEQGRLIGLIRSLNDEIIGIFIKID